MQRTRLYPGQVDSLDDCRRALHLLEQGIHCLENHDKASMDIITQHQCSIDKVILTDIQQQLHCFSKETRASLTTCSHMQKKLRLGHKPKQTLLGEVCVNDYLARRLHRTFDALLHTYRLPYKNQYGWSDPLVEISQGQAMLLIVRQFQQLHVVSLRMQELIRQRSYTIKAKDYYDVFQRCCHAHQQYIDACTKYAATQFKQVAQGRIDIPSLTYMLLQQENVRHYYQFYRDCNENPMTWLGEYRWEEGGKHTNEDRCLQWYTW